MSCRRVSREALARIMPVSPPTVNRKMKPRAHSIGGVNFTCVPYIVESHLNTFTPVGTAITIVALVK